MTGPTGDYSESARARLTEALVATGFEDPVAFRRLYRLTSGKLFGICLRICGDRQAAEDVLQEIYVTIWKRAGAYDPGRSSPITWLATIARNRAIDWRRAHRVSSPIPIEGADQEPCQDASSAELLLSDEAARELQHCLDQLDAEQRHAIRTAFFDGLTYAELASRRGVPLGTMKSWVRRGLLRLRGCLDGER